MNIIKFSLTSLVSAIAIITMPYTLYANDNSQETYINGGIGREEADDMRTKAGRYNLRLYLSEGKLGHSITDVPVTITDKKGNVTLDLTSSGPMLFLQVEKGSYKIRAQYNDITLTKNITVINQRGVNVYLNWKNTDVDMEDAQAKEF
jgi:hypothetical protein